MQMNAIMRQPVLFGNHPKLSRGAKALTIAAIGAAALAGCQGLNTEAKDKDSTATAQAPDTYTPFPHPVDCARTDGDENVYEPFKNLKLESPFDDDGWADAVNTNEKNVPVTDCVYRGTPWEIDGDFLFDDHKKAHYKSGKSISHKKSKTGLPSWNPSTAPSTRNPFASATSSPSASSSSRSATSTAPRSSSTPHNRQTRTATTPKPRSTRR